MNGEGYSATECEDCICDVDSIWDREIIQEIEEECERRGCA